MFHVYWPATACLTLVLICGVIYTMLRWGPRICKTRHVALPERSAWQTKAYSQDISIA